VTTSQVQDYKVVINKKKVYRFKEIDEKLKKKFRTIILNLVKKRIENKHQLIYFVFIKIC
jgi:hypothetical protein